MKRDEAAAFVRTIKGPQWGGAESTVAVNVDPGMLAAMQRATLISPAWLAACTSTMGTSLNSMAVLAANNNAMQVSSLSPEAGLPTVCNARSTDSVSNIMTNARPGSRMLFLCKYPVQNVVMMHMIASVCAVTCWYVCRRLKVQGCCRWLFPLHCQPEGGFQLRK